jgi:hypothetical protein
MESIEEDTKVEGSSESGKPKNKNVKPSGVAMARPQG